MQNHAAQIATNSANIAHLEKGYDALSDKIDHLEGKIEELDKKIDRVIAGLAANENQWLGASKLARFLKEVMPYLCAAIASVMAYSAGRMH